MNYNELKNKIVLEQKLFQRCKTIWYNILLVLFYNFFKSIFKIFNIILKLLQHHIS